LTAGLECQPKLAVRHLPSCWKALYTPKRREHHQHRFSKLLHWRVESHILLCSQGSSRHGHQGALQRVEQVQHTSQRYCSWKYCHRYVSARAGLSAENSNTVARQDPAFTENRLGGIPGGRWGHPDDFKGPAVFLASDASAYITGEILVVDGVRVQSTLPNILS
jgi:hypothetical protein